VPGALIVGAGLGALRTAESLRASGFAGPITVVGDEPHLPYTRPPLSKEALLGGIDVAALEFRRRSTVDDVTWELGTPVESASLADRTVTLADGRSLDFDGLVIATGIRPRRLPIPGPAEGRVLLRTVADAERIRAELAPGRHVLIMGAGFIGCEVAATARRLGAEVSVVAVDEEPMVRPLGPELGAAMRRRHEQHGVRFHLGHTIDAFTGDDRVRSATLSDGTELPADLVIEAVGSVPNVEWLAGNDLDLSDGVLVDGAMQVTTDLAPTVAVGDIARHPNALFGATARRVEHWGMPTETGRRAGRTLAALLAGEEPDRSPFATVPSFWSDQYDHTLQSFGMPGLATGVRVADGDLDGPSIVEYLDADGLVGVVGIDRTKDLAPYRAQLADRTTS
jgi:3-phenylpropionate/trans-cinnamate dioxygenase ferredoxin reductase component